MASNHASNRIRKARFEVAPNRPLALSEDIDAEAEMSPEVQAKLDRVGRTLDAYRSAVKNMLEGKYEALRAFAPTFLTDACCSMAFLLPDGIIVRHDLKKTPDQKGFVGIIEGDGNLAWWAPRLSGAFVHCPDEPAGYDPHDLVTTVTFLVAPADRSGPERTLFSQRLYAIANRSAHHSRQSQPVQRPTPLVGLRNEFDVQVVAQLVSEQSEPGREFIVRRRIKLPLGWEAFEVFPPYDANVWDPSLPPHWAESDLLAAVVQRNLTDAHFRAIDPNAQARKEAAQVLAGFEALLTGPEEPLHQYVKAHPEFLLPTKVRSWSKLALGSRETDFVLKDASGDYLLVELEQPGHLLFGKKGKPRAALEDAIDQVLDWKRYLAENVRTVQQELGLAGISTNPRALVVIGRSSALTEQDRRKLIAMENDRPKLKIMTYDDLLANAKATYENILGPIWDPGPGAEVYLLPPNDRDHELRNDAAPLYSLLKRFEALLRCCLTQRRAFRSSASAVT